MAGSSGGSPRSPSLASSATVEDREKLAVEMDELAGGGSSRESADLDFGKEEEQHALLPDDGPEPPKSSFRTAVIWMVVNTLATIGIVRPLYS
ncbi:hypothetical protein IMZ48_48860 [Candidatus Bathyarchaeota archaeon]|nr:hypothetical protein [Candidatus Bathyarchaeota archaeon]